MPMQIRETAGESTDTPLSLSRDRLSLIVLRAKLQQTALAKPKKIVGGAELYLLGLEEGELNLLLHLLKGI